jgi:membrane-associated protease RseP (regulator of RpoE activity)
MRKNFLFLVIAGICLILITGCATNKKTYARGWVGGEYLESNPSFIKKLSANYFEATGDVIPALPAEIKQKQSSAVFVSRVFDNTPLKDAGIQEGDLIVALNDQQVEDLNRFREIVDQSMPEDKLRISLYRAGEMKEIPVVVGKETYQKWNYFHLGFRLGTELNPIPSPDFNILNLISYKTNDTRLELNSPEYKYYRQAIALPPEESERKPESLADAEGWDAWFVIFGFQGKKIILNQQS